MSAISPLRNPLTTGPILLAILCYPAKLASVLPPRLFELVTSVGVVRTLKICLSISIGRFFSNRLSSLVLNNSKQAATLIKSQELALITGGASGIGEMMAREFATKGVRVVILDLQPPKNELPKSVFFYQCNVTDSSQLSEVGDAIRKAHGHPTILINNAGVAGTSSPLLSCTEAEVRKCFEVNTMSHFWTVKEFVPDMAKKNHGHVVTVSSMSAYLTLPGMVDYACTKNSTVAFHEGLRSELRAKYNAPNVRTTLVSPTWVNTPLTADLFANPRFKEVSVEAKTVVTSVVDQVLSGKSAHLILPRELNFVSTLRAWPSWLQESIRYSRAKTLDIFEDIKASS
ncbi:hypothetical protein PVAG01_07069 [Phlyctema vagabunda]|uniref:Uncharacterized protein n=1 Tax=Phlyctema vagabunda TaxID=108571 RepID=A0ABR4PBD0_9HELO